MRHFVYYSSTAPTSGGLIQDDLQKAGRLDIAIHTVIAAFFLSHDIRRDVILHLVFDGPSDPPKHLEFAPNFEGKTGEDKIYLNKKDISKIIKKMLYKYQPGKKTEVFPGYFIEKKPLSSVVKNLIEAGSKLYLLDQKGSDIRDLEIAENPVFLLGDHEGLPRIGKELKRYKSEIEKVSIGPKMYFASQTAAIVNNELDRRGI